MDPIKFTLSDKHQQKFVNDSTEQDDQQVEMVNPSKAKDHSKEMLMEMITAAEDNNTSADGPVCTMEDGCISCQG